MSSDATTYRAMTMSRMRPRAAKSMPCPGTTFMPEIMSAIVVSPEARSCVTTCSLLTPAGSREPMNPAKMRSVPHPSTRGPSVERITETIVSARPPMSEVRSGASRRSSRALEPQKFSDFSTGIAMPGPPPGPRR